MSNTQEIIELNIMQIVSAVWKRIVAVILTALLFGAAACSATYFFITPTYQASALLYVNNSSISLGGTDFGISSSELMAAQSLVDTYIVILSTRTTLNEVIERAEIDCSYQELREMISAAAVNSTEIFEVVVTGTDPDEAERIANAITYVLPDKIAGVVDGSSVRIVDYAVTPVERATPSYSKNIMIGILLGLVVSVTAVVLNEMFDVFVRTEQQLQTYSIPVLALIPDMRAANSSGYYRSGYGTKYYYTTDKGAK